MNRQISRARPFCTTARARLGTPVGDESFRARGRRRVDPPSHPAPRRPRDPLRGRSIHARRRRIRRLRKSRVPSDAAAVAENPAAIAHRRGKMYASRLVSSTYPLFLINISHIDPARMTECMYQLQSAWDLCNLHSARIYMTQLSRDS